MTDQQTKVYDPAGTDQTDPAACTLCDADAKRTDELRPSGHGFKVLCVNGHTTNGMPRGLASHL